MTSKMFKTFVVCSGLALGALAAHAETLTLSVPFAFSAGGKELPAGTYSVETAGNMIALRGLPGSAMVLAIPSSRLSPPSKTEASFEETSTGNVLATVTAPSGVVYSIPAVKHSLAGLTSPPAGTVLSKRP